MKYMEESFLMLKKCPEYEMEGRKSKVYVCGIIKYGTSLTKENRKAAADVCKGNLYSCPFFNIEERKKVIYEMASHAEIALYNSAVNNIGKIGEGNISKIITKTE